MINLVSVLKKLSLSLLFSLVIFTTPAFAATINKANVAKGYVTIAAPEASGAKPVAVIIQNGSQKYTYIVTNASATNYPLQMGNGTYKIDILESLGNNKYKPITQDTVAVSGYSDLVVYSNPNQIVNYTPNSVAVKNMKAIVAGSKSKEEELNKLYNYIISNYTYDFTKAANPPANYIPAIDSVYASKKGICYDYAALFASGLRSAGIPAKLQMGYCTEIKTYHAWNEVYYKNAWYKMDTTYDAQAKSSNVKFTQIKENSKYTVVKQY